MILLLGIGSELEQKQKRKQLEFLNTFQPDQFDFQKHKSFTSYDLLTKIAIDEQRQKVYIWGPEPKKVGDIKKAYAGMPYIIHTYNYSDIVAIILKEDNRRTASVQRDTHFAHFLLNKLKEEDASKNNATHPPVDKISSMDLEIVVDNKTGQRHLIRFYHTPYIYIRKDTPEYRAYFRERQEWFEKLNVIIEQQNDTAVKIETPNETIKTIESPVIVAPPVEDPTEKTQILVDLDTTQYSLRLHAETEVHSEVTPEVIQAEPPQEEVVEKPLSYFEQLVEKNRRQLRGDSTNNDN